MLVLGLLLAAIGGLAILGGVLTASGSAEYLGLDVGPLALFLLGVAAGVALWWGFACIKFGMRRSLHHRREQKQLAALSDKLDRVEAERRGDAEPDPRRES